MLFTTEWLTSIFGDYKGAAADRIEIGEVATDSRKKTHKSLFIPIIGENFDGHDYIKQAFDQGAVATLWQKEKQLPSFLPTDFPVFFVEDTLKAFQELAGFYRDKINPIVIGITGSNGKTTTKDIVASVLKTTFITEQTKGNLNNHIGLPLTILSMEPGTEVLIVEMGMNQYGEIETLSNIAKPDIAVITNIGESHIEYLGSRADIAKAKLEIISGMKHDGFLIVDGDEPLLEEMHKRDNVITCGFDADNEVVVEKIKLTYNHTQFQLSDGYEYSVPLLGNHHALNAAFAIAIAEHLKIPKSKVVKGLTELERTSMRFELLKGKNDASIINDAYNASPTSMKAAINVVKQMKGFKQKVLVLGDIFELGNESKLFHQSIAESIDNSVDALFTFGEESEEISSTVNKRNSDISCSHFTSKTDLLNALEDYLTKDTLILFKASRGMQFELFVEKLTDPS
ncbi:UDP-N-acetylmuramoyl-tripeptide--D-alanyl-D-alanine ligase [Virgibacillus litoralis]|uniref:UDP-N-acetylmuramoyl-tripeptide--D-alanyl-D-alanine ligase n=1 Tax=Virgibacillus litoralis TaxID=578221 RepID=A0ABS4HI59_9BACI|nr:UDP-N-acetylmuramoyl-tripeptide--D-alanyl-D-alanine ligase [Virgibacillus litoralis]MBP1950610.1 UDP-N-acetylmuramoyl-tripeptide--D-alanyl-D-alanine ligase [Virgibacillus litoralis]